MRKYTYLFIFLLINLSFICNVNALTIEEKTDENGNTYTDYSFDSKEEEEEYMNQHPDENPNNFEEEEVIDESEYIDLDEGVDRDSYLDYVNDSSSDDSSDSSESGDTTDGEENNTKLDDYTSCSYAYQAKVNNELTNVRAYYFLYQVEEQDEYDDMNEDSDNIVSEKTYVWYSLLRIYNLSSDLYAVINFDDVSYTVKYSDNNEDGYIEYNVGNLDNIKNVTINIYHTNSSCSDNVIKTINVVIPKYNTYYGLNICQENPDYYNCNEFTFYEDVTLEDFVNQYDTYTNNNDNSDESGEETNNDINYTLYIIIGSIVGILIIFIVSILLIRYNKQKRYKI